ncbi:MAG TPA: hypothetical protein VHO27_11585, partial [Angustibacter sp.]|nr:hypothetical protein [Angustibacter sp.]
MTANPATEPVASVQQEPISVHGVRALEILDSRSRPTLMVSLSTDRGTWDAGVPSGASTGTREAVELRDGDPSRYGGSGVQQALTNVNGPIAERLKGATFQTQQELDE